LIFALLLANRIILELSTERQRNRANQRKADGQESIVESGEDVHY
jgi:hypothetical protein